jgi:K+-sensing histidine kinase KdpD
MNTQGIGLGLHICKIIINEFGGDIHCESKWQEGSNFIFLMELD